MLLGLNIIVDKYLRQLTTLACNCIYIAFRQDPIYLIVSI